LEAILCSLRIGAVEFLYSPFEPGALAQAAGRIQRLFQSDSPARPQPGKVVMFASAKPGSGASTLAAQTAFALKRITGKRILLADFDLMGGTVAFYLNLRPEHSLLDAIRQADRLDPVRWNSMVQQVRGVDVLTAPEAPGDDVIEPSRLQDILEYARLLYDWVLVDLPTVFQGISLLALSHSDRAILVTTPELPSLHLTRKAVNLLEQLGFGKERFEVIVNRAGKREGFGLEDMGRILNCPTGTVLPNDYFCLHNALSLGQPHDATCELDKTLQAFARRLAGAPENENARQSLWQRAKQILGTAQTEALHAANR
jgi:pilus assembly protein CpaE